MKRTDIKAAMLGIALLCASSAAGAAGFDQFVAFGDSTVDTGAFRYSSTGNAALDAAIASAVANGASGAFVGPGVMNTTILAGRFGLNAAPTGDGGTNYANGGAHTVSDVSPNVPTVQCIANYLSSVNGVANPHALYEIRTGDNDLAFVASQSAAWIAANPNYLSGIASALSASVATLQAAGARTILVPNSYNCAVFAGLGGGIASGNTALYARSRSFDAMIWSDLSAAGVNFIPADIDSVFKYVIKNPALFGFTPASVLAANAVSHISALLTTSAMATPAQEGAYLFVDPVHLTTAGQRIEADYEYALITAPSQVSLIVESAVQDGLTRAALLQRQFDLSGQQCQPARASVWAGTQASALNFRSAPGFPGDSSSPFGCVVGADAQTSEGALVGAALSEGGQRLRFSTGGDCSQVDEAVSLYIGREAGPLWGNATATYGLFQDRLARQVPLGIFIDQNNGNTAGGSLALALRGGEDFDFGPIATGPVAGAVLQHVHLDGFTESGATGVTALSFGGQLRDSFVSQLGWRVSRAIAGWLFLADVEWNHDWADADREATASLTSTAAAPYIMDAAAFADNWANASFSATYKLNSRVMLRAAATAMAGNPRVTSYGGDLDASIDF